MEENLNKIYFFDTTLRDGQQTTGVDFSVEDKIKFSQSLDELGLDYIEGGWPGSNPTDDKFFQDYPKFRNSNLVAFGMTRRPSSSVANDPGLNNLINTIQNIFFDRIIILASSLINFESANKFDVGLIWCSISDTTTVSHSKISFSVISSL